MVQEAKTKAEYGKVIDRIPQLAKANPGWFAVQIYCKSGHTISFGDTACVFPLMSVIKTFCLLYLLEHFGAETVFGWVGVESSDAPFNSLEQLVSDRGHPAIR
ncbi:hypothetical protein ANSO36C_23220 [Nostoc cf. commune SO-36]|uniref:glutaminase n=1 Tax=Nostoc cf. commune SO-36 TaxID=449208 RepID=A0ABN6Q2A2_NOSCO|nr:hypothetical protein ANSO36C_23220 [Nostoc cf. commune SO-36]